MTKLVILPPAARYLKKLKEKPLKEKFRAAIDQLQLDPYCGDPKTGDLSYVYCYDIIHNKTNYELANTIIEEGKVINKCVYSVLGIDVDGKKDILGIWISETESAAFWATVFNELKNRGVKDILIACHDNLSGFANALEAVFPKTENQLCIIHMIRNSTKYVSYKELKAVMADLKEVYGAVSKESALCAGRIQG